MVLRERLNIMSKYEYLALSVNGALLPMVWFPSQVAAERYAEGYCGQKGEGSKVIILKKVATVSYDSNPVKIERTEVG